MVVQCAISVLPTQMLCLFYSSQSLILQSPMECAITSVWNCNIWRKSYNAIEDDDQRRATDRDLATDSQATEDSDHWTMQSSFDEANDACCWRCTAATTGTDETIDVNILHGKIFMCEGWGSGIQLSASHRAFIFMAVLYWKYKMCVYLVHGSWMSSICMEC